MRGAGGQAVAEAEAGVMSRVEAAGGLSERDVAELLETFNSATQRLQQTHAALRGEVGRLQVELTETKRRLGRASELAALGEMAAGIAHEIRNPLGSIKLYAAMLAQDLGDRPGEQGVARRIVSAVDRLNAVVGDVLAFSREIRLAPDDVSVGEAFGGAVESCQAAIESGGVELRWPSASESATTVRVDAGLVHQALVNVVRNACEAMAERARGERVLTLGVARRSVLGEDGRRLVMSGLVVRDTGPGVPAEVRRRMFNPFFTTREAGTGLGLAIVHRIMDAHGGRVEIRDGSPGAVVELLFPRTPEGRGSPPAEPDAGGGTS